MFTAKGVLGTIVEIGTGAVMGQIIKHNTDEEMTTVEKVIITIGGIGISGVVGAASRRWIESTFDEIEEVVNYTKLEEEEEE